MRFRGEPSGIGIARSGTPAPVADRVDELLTAVREHLTTVSAGRYGDEADDSQRENEADHHAEDESEHVLQPDGVRPQPQIGTPTVAEL